MRDCGIVEALTTDDHFQQAGFRILLQTKFFNICYRRLIVRFPVPIALFTEEPLQLH